MPGAGREGCQWSPNSMPDTAGRTRRSSRRRPARTCTRRTRSARSGARSSTAAGSTARPGCSSSGRTRRRTRRSAGASSSARPASGPRDCSPSSASHAATSSINAFLYSVFGQHGGTRHIDNPAITAYRNRWLDTIARRNDLQAIITFGRLADRAYEAWKATPAGAACPAVHASATHPTFPESASSSGQLTKAAAMARAVRVVERRPDHPAARGHARRGPATRAVRHGDHQGRPGADPRRGPPARAAARGCARSTRGRSAAARTPRRKRATITVTIPRAARTWPALG